MLLILSHIVHFFTSTGTLNGPDIRKLMKSEAFTNSLPTSGKKAWIAIKSVITNVLGGKRIESGAEELVVEMMRLFKKIGMSMTLKMHFLNNHLDKFLQQSPKDSDEQGERFHQLVMSIEKRFKGKKVDSMLGEICWWTRQICIAKKDKGEIESEAETDDDSGSEGPMHDDDDDVDESPPTKRKRTDYDSDSDSDSTDSE